MKTLFLHVGMHKTGSSSIQSTCHYNRRRLLDYGFYYPGIHVNHSVLLYSMFCRAPHKYHMNRSRGITTPAAAMAHNEVITKRLTQELDENRSDSVILSGEDISVLHDEGVERLRQFVEPYFDEVRVLGFVRPPKSFVNSVAQEEIKHGRRITEFFTRLPTVRYRSRFEKFLTIFGPDHVTLRVFVPSLLPGGCVVAAFLDEIGAPDELYSQLKIRNSNESLSFPEARVISEANARLRRTYPAPARLPRKRISGTRFLLPDSLLSQAADGAREEIAWIEDVLGLQLGDFDVTGVDDDDVQWQEFKALSDEGQAIASAIAGLQASA